MGVFGVLGPIFKRGRRGLKFIFKAWDHFMHKDTKFCYSGFDISTFGFKAPPYWTAAVIGTMLYIEPKILFSPIKAASLFYRQNSSIAVAIALHHYYHRFHEITSCFSIGDLATQS